jgi:hypothetical protein
MRTIVKKKSGLGDTQSAIGAKEEGNRIEMDVWRSRNWPRRRRKIDLDANPRGPPNMKAQMAILRPVKCQMISVLVCLFLIGCSGESASKPINQDDRPQFVAEKPARGEATARKVADRYEGVAENEVIAYRANAGQPDEDGWCIAGSTRGDFSVEMPGQYSDSMVKSTTTTGGICVFHTVARKTADEVEFNVLQTEIIGKRPPAMESPARSLGERFERLGAAVSHRRLRIRDLPADRLSIRADGVSAEMVVISTSANDYVLAVQWRPEVREVSEGDIERFFSSFKLVSRPQ